MNAAIMRDMYWDPIEDMFTDRNGIVYAQSLIYAEIDDLTDSSPEHADIRKSASKRLVAEMAGLGYHIRYMLNGKEKFSNITPDDEMKAADLLGGEAAHLDHITASQDNVHAFFFCFGSVKRILTIGLRFTCKCSL